MINTLKDVKEINGKPICVMDELYEIDFMGGRERVLNMKNPSEDKEHDEFVPPETKDIKDALRIRWGLNEYVEPLFRC